MMHQVKINTSSKPVLHFVLAVLSFAEKTMQDNLEIEGDFENVYSITVEEIDDGQIEVFTGEESNTTDTSS
jgi:hypothetical protein